MRLRLAALAFAASGSHGWWYNATTAEAPAQQGSAFKAWIEERAPWASEQYDAAGKVYEGMKEWTRGWSYESSGTWDSMFWITLDYLVGMVGWVVFGSAWSSLKSGFKHIFQLLILLGACLVAHYIWAFCYPFVSVLMALVMALVWVCRRFLRMFGTMAFHTSRWMGGVPEAAEAEFHGPGVGKVPETAILRGFKRTGAAEKSIVVRRDGCTAVFQVGSDSQTIRSHGLYVP